MESQSVQEKNTGGKHSLPKQGPKFFVIRGGKTRDRGGEERKRSERFSWREHRWRGDGKIIESRLSHRRTKEIFHRPTNFLAKWSWCIKIAEEKRKIERERERNENKNRDHNGSGNRKRELKTRRSINMIYNNSNNRRNLSND